MRAFNGGPRGKSEREASLLLIPLTSIDQLGTSRCINSRYKGVAHSSAPTRRLLASAQSTDSLLLPTCGRHLGRRIIGDLQRMQSINRMIWGPTPQEKVRKWQTQLKREQRMLDREVHSLDLACNKVKADIKRLAQKGDTKNAKLLAREVVRTNRQKQRMLTSKAQLNSINMQLGHQLGAGPLSFLVLPGQRD